MRRRLGGQFLAAGRDRLVVRDIVGSGLFDVDRRDDRSVGLGRDREAVFVDIPGLHDRIVVGPVAGVPEATGRRIPLVEPGEVVAIRDSR